MLSDRQALERHQMPVRIVRVQADFGATTRGLRFVKEDARKEWGDVWWAEEEVAAGRWFGWWI